MEKHTLSKVALGSTAKLGDLYDARRDKFCKISIFKKTIPESCIRLIDSDECKVRLVHTDDFTEKFSKLDVSAELQVSVLAGFFKLKGSGRYLSDNKTSARTVKSSLIYNVKTKDESVNIYHEDLKEAFSLDAIESGVATHVVGEISWGANAIISCFYENRENKNVKEIGGSLSAHLEKACLSISGSASVKFNEGDNSNGVKFDVRMFGDILPKNEELPTTFEAALELMKKLPSLISTCNEGKGKPLEYELIPIELLKSYLNFSTKADAIVKTLEEASLTRIVQMFEQMSAARQKLNDLYQDAMDFKYCLKEEDLMKINELKNQAVVEETSLRSQLSSVLKAVRSGYSDVLELEDLLLKFQSSDFSPLKMSSTLATWGKVVDKINFARSIGERAKYIVSGVQLEEEILKDFEFKSLVFYFTKNAKLDRQSWTLNRQIFYQELNKNDKNCRYYAVDCDMEPGLMIKGYSSCIQVFENGRLVIEDMLKESTEKVPIAKPLMEAERLLHIPSKRAHLKIACAGKMCNRKQSYEWHCAKCMC